ncbi:MAG: PAS domain S-box protein [Acidobacteriaceae bacterium]
MALVLASSIVRLENSAQWVEHTDRVIAGINRLQSLMLDEETGVRGYLLTRDPAFLAPWERGSAAIDGEIAALGRLFVDNPEQETRLAHLRELHTVWRRASAQRIALPAAGERLHADSLEAKRRMDALRADVGALLGREGDLRQQRTDRNRRALRSLFWLTGLLTLGTGIALGTWVRRRILRVSGAYEQQSNEAREQHQWLQATLSSIGDGVIACDAEGNVSFMNAVAQTLTGWTEAAAAGGPLHRVFQIVNEETRAIVESPADKVRRLGTVVGLANHTILIRKDGVDIHIDDSGAPIPSPSGELAGIVLVFRDIGERRAAEHAVRESEMRFRQLANAMPQIVWMASPDGCIDYYNERWYEFTGFPRGKKGDESWAPLLHPEDVNAVKEAWYHSVATGEHYEMESRFWDRQERSWRWFLGRAVPVHDAQGNIVRWIGTRTDIHRLKQAEAELAEAQERIRVGLKNAPLLLYTCDRELRYTWIHRPHRDFSQQDILGCRDDEIVGVDDARELMEFKRSVLEGGTDTRRQLRIVINGRPEVYDMTAEPLRNGTGEIVGLTVSALDLTERAAAEQERERLLMELRESSEFLALAQAVTNAGFWQYWPATGDTFLTDGALQLFGLKPGARPNVAEIFACIHCDDRQRVERSLKEAVQTGHYYAQFRVPQPDGTDRWLAGRARVMTGPQGNAYYLGVNMDISMQRQIEEALRKSEKLAVVGRLAATISHEINNPPEAVTNLLYLMQSETSIDTLIQYAKTAQDELARVSHIVTHTLRFHRQATVPTWERVDLLLDSAIALYQGRMTGAQIRLDRKPRSIVTLLCFASELRQVFTNLIGNAFDANRSGGRIQVRTREGTHWRTGARGVRVTIADGGHGMNAKTLGRIFEPFFTTKGDNGTGLGLWITLEIIRKHRGAVMARSSEDPAHQGTVFCVFLPFEAEFDEANGGDAADSLNGHMKTQALPQLL